LNDRSPAPLRIIVADDQASVREGLVLLLGGLPGIEVVASAANGARAIELVAEHQQCQPEQCQPRKGQADHCQTG
jgi:CheY-like chemotaxis protein